MIPFFVTLMMFLKTISSLLKEQETRALLFTVGLTLTVGTMVYHNVEGWSWLDSLYFSVITLTTVGYGDFSPQTALGKIFTIIYIFVGLGILFGLVEVIGEHIVNQRIEVMERKKQRKEEFKNSSVYSGWPGKKNER